MEILTTNDEQVKERWNAKLYFKNYYLTHKDRYVQQNQTRKTQFHYCELCKCKVGLKSKKQHESTSKHKANIIE